MSLINVSNLTFGYDKSYDNIFQNVSFMIDTDWKLGFVGRNGRGKTTFLNLLLNKLEYSGVITHNVSFDYFPFVVKDKNQNTMDIIQQIAPECLFWQVQKELNLLDIDEDCLYRPYDTLSGGEQSKILLAALFLKEDNFLLIDEPTNHLDINARQTVSKYLDKKKSFILVSHDRTFLDGCIDHVLSINKSNIEVQKGNFSSWLANKELQDSFERAQNQKLAGEIDRLKDAAKRSADWSQKGHRESTKNNNEGVIGYKEFHRKKAGKLDSQKKNLERRQQKAIEEKSGLLKNIEGSWDLKINPLKHHSDILLDIRDLSLSFGDKNIFNNINFTVKQNDRIALCGKNGSGKSSLLKLLLDKDSIKHDGQINLASGIKFSYVSQDTSFLQGSLTDFADDSQIDETLFKTILARLDFNKVQFDKDISQYSSGQKKKVLIARSLCQNAHLYIWDEPLNYIDIISRIQIEELIKNYSITMLFVEHDKAFMDSVATDKIFL